MNPTDILHLALPELILSAAALTLMIIGAFMGHKSSGLISLLSALSLAGAGVAAAIGVTAGQGFNGGFISDAAASYSKIVIYTLSAVAIYLGNGWLKRIDQRQFEYPLLILLASIGMGMMVSAGDLISLYVGVELQSLALYVMAAFRRDDAKASEAGLKYFVLGALSSGLLLYGASLIYGFAGATQFDAIAAAVRDQPGTGVLFGLVFLICGLAFKVSAAPFHMWTPDVYEGAPTPVVAFFTGAPKFAAMILFTRALYQSFPDSIDQWRQVIMVVAVISVLVGAFAGLVQSNIKRLLAYSSIASMGYVLIGLSSGNAEGAQAVIILMTLYMVDATGFFAALTALSRDGKPMDTIASMAGLSRARPGMAIALTLLAASAIGIPPLPGFWGKFYVFKAAIDAGQWVVAIIGLVASVVAAFYYLRLIKVMWLDPAPGAVDPMPKDARAVTIVSALFAFPLVMAALTWIEPFAAQAATSFGLP